MRRRFFQQRNRGDCHAAIDRLCHVVNGEKRSRRRDESFHFDAGPLDGSGDCLHANTWQRVVECELDLKIGECNLMAERNGLRSSLGGHNSGNACHSEHIAFLERIPSYRVERGR